ncbi:PREDICTED: putative F-box protein At5g14160 [Camelina sativa]|uniref:F-box protein At5g14160 n=1 Tax=Camelina sativa TaxID=90675 RepID=A0ABM1QV56_CAMSA|nr:PREDICTED: putative F-box protein At5g14160 [Camelina sativa]
MALIQKRQALNSRRRHWSELPEDVIRLILGRLRCSDFHRARAVCSAWYSVWGECVPIPNQVPWLILFPDPAQCRRSCIMYNPQEEENVYTIQDLGVDPCLASCGTWLLMSDPRLNLYLVNVLTLDRINLVPIESQRDQLFSEPPGWYKYVPGRHFASKAEMIGFTPGKAVLWVDEKTKNYVVACSWGENGYTAFCRKGDCEWRRIPPLVGCSDMVLKDRKLYIYYEDGSIGISDLKFPTKAAHILQLYPPFRFHLGALSFPPRRGAHLPDFIDWKTNLVITISGDFLMVASVLKRRDLSWHFRVYKFNSANNDWEQTVSLGDQAVILDLGITVLASSDIQGITRNSIYFSGLPSSQKDVFVFNLSSQRIQRLSASSISSRPFSDARWLFPTY